MSVKPTVGIGVRTHEQERPRLCRTVNELNDETVRVGEIVLLDVRNPRLAMLGPGDGLDFTLDACLVGGGAGWLLGQSSSGRAGAHGGRD